MLKLKCQLMVWKSLIIFECKCLDNSLHPRDIPYLGATAIISRHAVPMSPRLMRITVKALMRDNSTHNTQLLYCIWWTRRWHGERKFQVYIDNSAGNSFFSAISISLRYFELTRINWRLFRLVVCASSE